MLKKKQIKKLMQELMPNTELDDDGLPSAKPRVSSRVNHKFVENRHYYYHGADCYVYETICGFCKKKVGGWSEQQANDEWEKHCC